MKTQLFEPRRLALFLILWMLLAPRLLPAGPLDSWHARVVPISNPQIEAMNYGNGRFVAFSSGLNRVFVSTNGIDWEAHPAPYPGFQSANFGNGVFLAAFASVASQPQRIYSSTDGVTWVLRFVAPDSDITDIRAMESGAGKWVAAGTSLIDSADLANWTTSAYGTVSFTDLAFGNGTFAAVDGAAVWTSPDGRGWTYRGTSFGSGHIAFGSGKFLMVSYPSGRTVLSTDGATWTLNPTTNVPPPFMTGPMTFAGGYFIALSSGSSANFLSSTNGTDWETHSFGTNWAATSIALGNNTMVAAGNSGVMQSDPFSGASSAAPAFLAIQQAPVISITGEPGRDYQIEYADAPGSNTFLPLALVHVVTNPCIYVDTAATNAAKRFYRAVSR